MEKMTGTTTLPRITIDLTQFKLHLELTPTSELTLQFNSPSRRFYLCVIALVVTEMKRQGRLTAIPLKRHHDLLALLNETIGGAAGSSETEPLLERIYQKWQHALPNLEEAPLFLVLGRKKGYEEGSGKTYPLTEAERDGWANLFEYQGSHEHVRLKFALDTIGATLDDVVLRYGDAVDAAAWDRFIAGLKAKEGGKAQAEPDHRVAAAPAGPTPPGGKRGLALPGGYRRVALLAASVVVLGTIAFAIWHAHVTPDPGDVASVARMAFPLPEEPSIAVLPFANLSGDPKQAFLGDGMTEAIITALTRVPRLFVIGQYSTAAYKGHPVQVKQVSEELGVRYVLEGSVQRSGDRVRISAELIDALTGTHLWAQAYDRVLHDLFALQDEITLNILRSLRVKLFYGGGAGIRYYRGQHGLDCYLKMEEADGYLIRWNIEDNTRARRMAEEAIALCPENPGGYEILGWVYHHDYVLGNTTSPPETLEKSMALAQKTLAMDDSNSYGHQLLGVLYSEQGDHAKAIAEGQRALALSPGGVFALLNYASSLTDAGRPEEAIALLRIAIRLTPFGPSSLYYQFGNALRSTGRFAEAVSAYQKAIQIAPDHIRAHYGLAATYVLMGREKEGRAEAAEVLRINPKFSLEYYAKIAIFHDQAERERILGALRQAGLK